MLLVSRTLAQVLLVSPTLVAEAVAQAVLLVFG